MTILQRATSLTSITGAYLGTESVLNFCYYHLSVTQFFEVWGKDLKDPSPHTQTG